MQSYSASEGRSQESLMKWRRTLVADASHLHLQPGNLHPAELLSGWEAFLLLLLLLVLALLVQEIFLASLNNITH